MNAVQSVVARGLLRTLSGFRGYPKGDGEARFVDVLCEISMSVEHAAATLLCFEGEFPTIREMRDAALGLRSKFEAKRDERKEWEAKYGKPDPGWSQRFEEKAARVAPDVDPKARARQYAEERRAMLWQSIRDGIYYTETSEGRMDLSGIDDKDERIHAFNFWKDAAQRNEREHAAEVQAFRVELQARGWDALMVYDYVNGSFPPAAKREAAAPVAVVERPITQADVKRELQAQGREAGDGE